MGGRLAWWEIGDGGVLGEGGSLDLGDGGPLMACERWKGCDEEPWACVSSPDCKITRKQSFS